MAAIRQNTARTAIALAFALACIALGSAQDFVGAPGAAANLFPKPERPVAGIVSPIWHDEKERDDAGEIQQVVQLLGIKPGMTVADIGSGSGYYVVQLAPSVGPDGRIFAEDITPDYLRNLRKRVRDLGLQNVTVVRGEPHDPRLPAHSLDVAILVHMYHEITQPYGLLYNLASALKPGARIGIVDALGPIAKHGTPPELLRCELAAVGYAEVGFHPLKGSNAYLEIAAAPSDDARTRPQAIAACRTQ
jgi:predicted methyltransferase